MTTSEETSPAWDAWRTREQEILEFVEEVTTNPLAEQERILEHILSKNAETEYLRRFNLDGAIDVMTFREQVPISSYDSYKPLIDRVWEGDKSSLLTSDPAVEILMSSGTSSGEPKLFPITEEDREVRGLIWNLMRPVLNRDLPGLEKGSCLFFYFMRDSGTSPSGLPSHPAVTSFILSSSFRDRPFDPSYRLTSPDEVVRDSDSEAAMYCHLLLGLLQRKDVLRFGAIFAAVILKAIRCLEAWCGEICEDITNGTLSARVKSEAVRSAVLPMLRKDPELAELLRSELKDGKASDGIIRRLWPNARVIDTICTGSMEAYLPALGNYSDNLQVINTQLYAATEGYFGINMQPLSPSNGIYYTLMPCAAYYEFVAIQDVSQGKSEAEHDEVLDLMSLTLGREYELLVTTVSGLYRYRMGDVVKLVGFYNSAPTFQFMRRINILLSVDTDKTDEKELHGAVCRGTEVLEREVGLRMMEYTSTADFSTNPGHYVIYWELNPSSQPVPTQAVLEQCCEAMEAALGFIYRRGRTEKVVGALELRVVQEGTFDLLANYALAHGATLSQYKTPRGISGKRAEMLEILNPRTVQSAVSQKLPPFKSGIFRPSRSGRTNLRTSLSGRRVFLESRSGRMSVNSP